MSDATVLIDASLNANPAIEPHMNAAPIILSVLRVFIPTFTAFYRVVASDVGFGEGINIATELVERLSGQRNHLNEGDSPFHSPSLLPMRLRRSFLAFLLSGVPTWNDPKTLSHGISNVP